MDNKLAVADMGIDVIKESLKGITEHHKEVGKIETPKGAKAKRNKAPAKEDNK